MNERIDNKYLTASHRPGEVILSEDMNELESVVKAGINANYEDIQKIEDGTIMVGNASQLQGATLSTYSDSELSDDDNKFPSSRQVKRYIDAADIQLGATLDLSIDSATYVVTATLKNSSGTALSTKTIDLPLESVVVDGDYDSATKEIVLTLDNGNTIRFSVADLVSGLQSEITNDNKLASDLVDDTSSTNKFVTTSEKQNWNSSLQLVGNIESSTNLNKLSTGIYVVDSVTHASFPTNDAYYGVLIQYGGDYKPQLLVAGIAGECEVYYRRYLVSFSSYTSWYKVAQKTSDLTNDSGFITKSVNDLTNYTDTVTLNTALAGKQATLVSGTNIKTINNYSLLGEGNITIESSGGTGDYDELDHRPQINSVTLTGNKSLSDLGIQPAGNYLTSESDPIFTASAAYGISSSNITSWNGKLDSSKVKTTSSSTSGDVYDVNYINSKISDLSVATESLTLTTSGWTLNSSTNLYEYEVLDLDVTANHRVDLILDITNQAKFTGSAYTQTFDGSYTIYTDELPTEAISCAVYITKVGV